MADLSMSDESEIQSSSLRGLGVIVSEILLAEPLGGKGDEVLMGFESSRIRVLAPPHSFPLALGSPELE